jgi:hypothetical protein
MPRPLAIGAIMTAAGGFFRRDFREKTSKTKLMATAPESVQRHRITPNAIR